MPKALDTPIPIEGLPSPLSNCHEVPMIQSPPLPIYIDSTMMNTFRSCPRKFAWEYLLNLRPPGRKVDLVAGAAFAAALEAAYLSYYVTTPGDNFAALKEAYRAFQLSWGDFEGPENHAKSFTRMFSAVLDYFDHYSFGADHVQPFAHETSGRPTFEFSFAIPLDGPGFPRHPSGEPFLYSGRFDAFGHLRDTGQLVVRDEKTTGRGFGHYWSKQWEMRGQFIGYTWAAQTSGWDLDTVIIRGIAILKTQINHIEAAVRYAPHLVNLWYSQLRADLQRLVNCWETGVFDFNFGDTCASYGTCSFIDLCVDPKPERWFNQYDREVWNPINRTSTKLSVAAQPTEAGE